MASRFASLLAAAGVAVVSAAPAPQSSGSGSAPCAQIASAISDGDTAFTGSVAYNCLKSVPNVADPAAALIDSLQAYVQWQSTLAWLKAPPNAYGFPAIDLVGRLNEIKSTATSGGYDSEYDFQSDILSAVRLAHDGHFNYAGDVLGQFVFQSTLVQDLVSVSSDGKELPKLYHLKDLSSSNSSSDAVAITKINGQDAVEYITTFNAAHSTMQDPDSQWNGGMPIYASTSRILPFAADYLYHGDSITVEYEDGTSKKDTVVATLTSASDTSAWMSITSGEDFYNTFCVPQTSSKKRALEERALNDHPHEVRHLKVRQLSDDSLPGYPEPVVRDDGYNVISGYFLEGSGYDDTAVLAISGFLPNPQPEDTVAFISNFQAVTESFLNQCRQAGKKKLIIDVTSNGGGAILLAHDLFIQLFPEVDRFAADNLRRPTSLVNFADLMTDVFETNKFSITSTSQQNAAIALGSSVISSSINPQLGLFIVQGEQFDSIAEVTAEVDLKGDKFTEYQWQPFSTPDASFNLTGVGSRANPPAAVFDKDNVVVLTDGTCGSSCTIFSYFMIYGVGVKFITAGGRPQTGTIQSLGGVEGSQVFPMAQIAQAAIAATSLTSDSKYISDEMTQLSDAYAILRSSPISPPQVNARNAFAPFDSDTPQQFLTQNANCKIFYTAEMIVDPVATWKRTLDAASDPDQWCIEGSQTPIGEILDNDDDVSNAFDPDSAAATYGAAGKIAGVVVGALALWLAL